MDIIIQICKLIKNNECQANQKRINTFYTNLIDYNSRWKQNILFPMMRLSFYIRSVPQF
jgi:hypothetical protein